MPDPNLPTEGEPAAQQESFPEMAQAARQAGAEAATSQHLPTAEVAHKGWVEMYKDQYVENQKAHRRMRWWAFGTIGVLTSLYLLVLLCVLLRFLDGRILAAMLGASHGPLNWHALVLVGVVLVVFAAIPLTFALALVKMISAREEGEDEGVSLKTPSTELGKVLLDLIRSMIAAAKH